MGVLSRSGMWWNRCLAVFCAVLIALGMVSANVPPAPGRTLPGTPSAFPYLNPGGLTPGSQQSGTGISTGLETVQRTLPEGIQRQDSATNLVMGYVGYFMSFYPYIAIGLIIFFGVRLILSVGKPEARKEALAGIINIALGTLIIYLAYGIVAFILSLTSPETAQQALQIPS